MYLFADVVAGFQCSFSSSFWPQVAHIKIIVFVVSERFLLLKKKLFNYVSLQSGTP